MKRILFFPYHPDIETIINYRNHLEDAVIVGVISFKEDLKTVQQLNSVLNNNDVSEDQLWYACDTVVLLDNYRGYRQGKYYEVLEKAKNLKKKVYVTPFAELQLDIKNAKYDYELLEYAPVDCDLINKEIFFETNDKLIDIEVPVVGIFGMGKNCGKFETQILTYGTLKKEHEVIWISSNSLGVLFGGYSIPNFLFAELSLEEKIIKFNYYVSNLLKKVGAEILLIGVPEGIAPFKEKDMNRFGEFAIVISNAVYIDTSILCMYYFEGEINIQGVLATKELIEHRFLITIEGIIISKTWFELQPDDRKIIYEYLNNDYLVRHPLKPVNVNGVYIATLAEEESVMHTIEALKCSMLDNIAAI